jgi:hypothetical protein
MRATRRTRDPGGLGRWRHGRVRVGDEHGDGDDQWAPLDSDTRRGRAGGLVRLCWAGQLGRSARARGLKRARRPTVAAGLRGLRGVGLLG